MEAQAHAPSRRHCCGATWASGEGSMEAQAHARRLQCPLVGFLAGGEFGAAGGSEFGALGFTTCLGLRGGEGVS